MNRATSTLAATLLLTTATLAADHVGPADADRAARGQPLEFVENRGQWDPRARYVARSASATIFLCDDGFRVRILDGGRRDAVDLFLTFEDSSPDVTLTPARPSSTSRTYLVGDPASHRGDVASFGELVYRHLYPGVDVRCYDAGGRRLEYDLVLAPDVHASTLVMRIEGADAIDVVDDDLVLRTPLGDVVHSIPHSYAVDAAGATRDVDVRLRRLDAERFTFDAVDRPAGRLVIDPILTASTLLGGNFHDEANDVAVDAQGFVYVCGTTNSTDFPTTPGYKPNLFSSSDTQDAFVTRFSPDLSTRIWSTYYGSIGHDDGYAIDVNEFGQACVVGRADGFWIDLLNPSTQTVATWGGSDVLVGMFTASGNALVAGGILRLAGDDEATDVVFVDNDTFAITGTVDQGDLPATSSSWDTDFNGDDDAFVMVLDVADFAVSISAATYLGGSDEDDGEGIAYAANSLFVTGRTRSADLRTSGDSSAGAAYDTSHNGTGTEDAFRRPLPDQPRAAVRHLPRRIGERRRVRDRCGRGRQRVRLRRHALDHRLPRHTDRLPRQPRPDGTRRVPRSTERRRHRGVVPAALRRVGLRPRPRRHARRLGRGMGRRQHQVERVPDRGRLPERVPGRRGRVRQPLLVGRIAALLDLPGRLGGGRGARHLLGRIGGGGPRRDDGVRLVPDHARRVADVGGGDPRGVRVGPPGLPAQVGHDQGLRRRDVGRTEAEPAHVDDA